MPDEGVTDPPCILRPLPAVVPPYLRERRATANNTG
jgi:hypothetical protein